MNLTFVFEGEEEFGSESLYRWIDANEARLQADVAIISDTGFFEGNVPAITVGLRGIMYAQIDVELSPVDLHSGMYGGTVQNPANALATIIAALKGPDGRVRVPGFYDDVEPLTASDREALAALPFDEEAYREAIPVTALVGETGFTILENKGSRPTLDVNGMWSGFTGEGAKTIIPAHAHAKISTRLVAHQDPAKIFEGLQRFVAEVAPPGVTVTTTYLHGGDPSHTHTDHPATRAAARALSAVYGVEPVFIREGGSIPVTAAFTSQLKPAGRAARVRAAGVQRPRPQRVARSRQLRARHAGDRAAVGRARGARAGRASSRPEAASQQRADGGAAGVGPASTPYLPAAGPSGRLARTNRGARMRHRTDQLARRTNGT